MNCLETRASNVAGNQQPSFGSNLIEGSETIPKGSSPHAYQHALGRSALHPTNQKDDDIVHPLQKCLDTCNQFVAGSSPAAGASNKNTLLMRVFLLLMIRAEKGV